MRNGWKTQFALGATTLVTALLAVGCQPKIYYQDPTAVETVTVGYGRTDLQSIANEMTRSLLQSPVIAAGRPVVYFHGVKNKTHEQVDTKNITDSIKTALVQSGRFAVLGSMEVPEEIQRQMEYQTASGMVRPDTAVRIGQQLGAQYFLYGDMTSIYKRAGRMQDVYYKFTLQMINLETGVLDWAAEKEISKAQKNALFGM